MQIAGTACHVCAQRIPADPDGLGCPVCELTFHSACVDDPSRCPQCHGDHAAALADAAAAVAAGRARDAWRARRTIVLVAALVLGLQVISAEMVWVADGLLAAVPELGRLAWVGAPFLLLYWGSRLARAWLVFALGSAALWSAAFLVQMVQAGNGPGIAAASVLTVVYIGTFALLVWSRRIADHLVEANR